ncbi:MAG: 2-oxoacid:acceptor oxidoreductase family protein [Dehalococcoidia bacterium]|nr:2-oxoacid:acceptor oxidoreductase family protein [Dehalococcoidia bacterium]
MRKEIVIAGFGGQGIQRLGGTLAKALDDKGFLISLKSNYGPAARGGNSFSQVVIKESLEDWPEVLMVDILVAMSQEGYNAWISKTSLECKVFFDVDMVKIAPSQAHQYPIPATKVANALGSQIVANMVMFGAVVAVTGLFSLEDLFGVIKKEAGKFSEVNLEAVKEGYKLGSMFKS